MAVGWEWIGGRGVTHVCFLYRTFERRRLFAEVLSPRRPPRERRRGRDGNSRRRPNRPPDFCNARMTRGLTRQGKLPSGWASATLLDLARSVGSATSVSRLAHGIPGLSSGYKNREALMARLKSEMVKVRPKQKQPAPQAGTPEKRATRSNTAGSPKLRADVRNAMRAARGEDGTLRQAQTISTTTQH